MSPEVKKATGLIVGIVGTFICLAMAVWMLFVIAVGLNGSGNDEQVSAVLGAITCFISMPVIMLTMLGWGFGLKPVR